jgi:hypothetical protein
LSVLMTMNDYPFRGFAPFVVAKLADPAICVICVQIFETGRSVKFGPPIIDESRPDIGPSRVSG